MQPRNPVLDYCILPPLFLIITCHADNFQFVLVSVIILFHCRKSLDAPGTPGPPEINDNILALSEKCAQSEVLTVHIVQCKVRSRLSLLQLQGRCSCRLLLFSKPRKHPLYSIDIAFKTPIPYFGRETSDGRQYVGPVLIQQNRDRNLIVQMPHYILMGNSPLPFVYVPIGGRPDAVEPPAVKTVGHTLVIPGPCGVEFPVERQQQLPDTILPLIKRRTTDIPIVHRGRGPLDLHTLVRDEKKMRLSATGPNGQFRQTSISNITTVSEASARINRDIDIHNPLFGFTLNIPDRQRIIGHIDKTTPDRKTLSRQIQKHCRQQNNRNYRFHFIFFFYATHTSTVCQRHMHGWKIDDPGNETLPAPIYNLQRQNYKTPTIKLLM